MQVFFLAQAQVDGSVRDTRVLRHPRLSKSDTEWSSTNKGTLLTIMNTRSAALRSLYSA